MSVEENTAVIRRLAEALNAGRPETGLEVWAEDLVFNGHTISPQTIAQLRAPHEMCLDRFDHGQNRIDKDADLAKIEPSSQTMFRQLAGRFVFECQRDVGEHRQLQATGCHQQRCGRTGRAAHRCNHDIGVEHISHILYNITS